MVAPQMIKQKFVPYLSTNIHYLQKKRVGANANAGLINASGNIFYMLQDDWEMSALSGFIQQAISVLEHDSEIGLINLYNDPSRFPLVERQISGVLKKYWICD